MGLQISECSTVGEYKTRSSSETGGDYIYVNKFNHSLVFSDNGTKALMSEPVIQENNIAWYVDYSSVETTSARVGSSDHPFANLDELFLFLPKNTNGHRIKVYVKADQVDRSITFDGFENLDIYADSSSASASCVFVITNCKNIKIYGADVATLASVYDKVGAITNSSVELVMDSEATNDGFFKVNGPIVNSSVSSTVPVAISITAVEGTSYFDVKKHSNVSFDSVEAEALKNIRVDNSEFTATSVISSDLTAINTGTIKIDTMYTSGASSHEVSISADSLSNIAINAYAEDQSEDSDYRDALVIAASNNSRISVISNIDNETSELIPVKSITANTGSYISVATLTGYLTNAGSGADDVFHQPALESHMTSTIMYVGDNLGTNTLAPTETKDTMGQINVAEGSAVDLTNYVSYNASTAV